MFGAAVLPQLLPSISILFHHRLVKCFGLPLAILLAEGEHFIGWIWLDFLVLSFVDCSCCFSMTAQRLPEFRSGTIWHPEPHPEPLGCQEGNLATTTPSGTCIIIVLDSLLHGR